MHWNLCNKDSTRTTVICYVQHNLYKKDNTRTTVICRVQQNLCNKDTIEATVIYHVQQNLCNKDTIATVSCSVQKIILKRYPYFRVWVYTHRHKLCVDSTSKYAWKVLGKKHVFSPLGCHLHGKMLMAKLGIHAHTVENPNRTHSPGWIIKFQHYNNSGPRKT